MPGDGNADRESSQAAYDRWAYERAIRESDLPANARLLALTLASALPAKSNRRRKMKAGEGQRLMETLATETGLSRAVLFRACSALEAAGFMSRIAQSAKRGRRSSIFRLHAPAKSHIETLGESHIETLGPSHIETQYRVLGEGRAPDEPCTRLGRLTRQAERGELATRPFIGRANGAAPTDDC